jgi:cytochrome c
MHWKQAAVLAPTLYLALSSGDPAMAQGKTDDIAAGRAILTKHCASCHSVASKGASPLDKAPPMRDIARRAPVENLAEALAEGIVTGHEAMPVFVFRPDEIGAILGYLQTLRDAR